MVYGKRQMQTRSQFLDDIPEGLYVEEEQYYENEGSGGNGNYGEKIVVYL
jgi:hypothetical protein